MNLSMIFHLIFLLFFNFANIGVASSCSNSNSRITFITSFNLKWFELMKLNQLKKSILQKFPDNNLVIYHEDDLPQIPGVCLFDLRTISWFEYELMNISSGMNQFFTYAGYGNALFPNPVPGTSIQPIPCFQTSLPILLMQEGKVLVIYHL